MAAPQQELHTWYVERPEVAAPVPPALIVGADVAALGMARGLGRAGVPVLVVDSNPRLPAMHSRYARSLCVQAISGDDLIFNLLELRTRFDSRPVLFLRSDVQVRTVSQHRKHLAQAFIIRLPEHNRVCDLLDKERFQSLAEEHGFPIPRAVAIHGTAELEKLGRIKYPAVVKPSKADFIANGAPTAQIVRTRAEAEAACRRTIAQAPTLIVQEWIEGNEADIYFCLQYRGEGGTTVTSFTGRKLRSWPRNTGSTARCTAAPEHDAELQQLTSEFFDQMRFVGICNMEYKRDSRSGKFFMIEPTVGRTDLQEEIATFNGVNIPLAAYRYELGLPLPRAETPTKPVVWSYGPSYWQSVVASRSFRGLRLKGADTKSACWQLDDPVPFAWYCLHWLRKVADTFRR